MVSGLACKNLGSCHSALIISKKLKKLKNQQLLRFMREVKPLCKEQPLTWRDLQANTENRTPRREAGSRNLGRLRCREKDVWPVIEELLEAHGGLFWEFKTEDPVITRGVSHVREFCHQSWTSFSKWILEKQLHVFLADGGGKDNKLDKAAPQMSIQIVAFLKIRLYS